MIQKYFLNLFFLLIITSTSNIWGQNIIIAPSPLDSLRSGDNYYNITSSLDSFWIQQESDFAGSGIKPYLRWKEIWKYKVRLDGSIAHPTEIVKSWKNLQKNATNTQAQSGSWIPLGPTNVNYLDVDRSGQGRINVIEVDPNNPNIIYVGSPGGGLWKSSNNGDSWEDLSYNLPAIGISGVAVDHNNSNIIYVTSGDEDGFTNTATGVYKTIDGGVTWSATGTLSSSFLGEIYINPNNSDMLWLVSWDGLYRTTNGGNTWSLIVSGQFKEIRLKPNDPSTIYAVKDNFNDTELYISNNSGASFALTHTFTGIGGRAVIAVTAANPGYLYIMLSNNDNSFNSIRLSTDSGNSFVITNNTSGIYYSSQSWYDLALAISDTDPEKLFFGCLILQRSLDSGQNITSINSPNWVLGTPFDFHADIHDIKIINQKIYLASDGGIYISDDEGYTFHNKSKGLNISQVYRIDVAQGVGTKVVGGLQDNGSFALSNGNWFGYNGNSDGMDAAIDPTGEKGYVLDPYGNNLNRFNFTDSTEIYTNAGVLGGNWVTPLEMGNNGTLYAGSDKIYRLDSNDTWDPVNNQTFTDIRNIRVAPENDHLILFGNEGSDIYISDGIENMTFSTIGTPPSAWLQYGGIVNFDFNRSNSQIIYVLTRTTIFQSNDGGQTFFDITGSIPISDTKVGIIHQASSDNNSLYVATTNAVYYKNDNMNDWKLFNTGLPPMQISDIEINNVENHILVSSYGKGVWRSPVHDNALVSIQESTLSETALIYPNPTNDLITLYFDLFEPSNIQIFNISGELLDSYKREEILKGESIDLTSYSSGTYILRIISNNHHINIKILKQ
jgi:hypothetical protein